MDPLWQNFLDPRLVGPDQLASDEQKPADLDIHCFQKRV